jgi:hypothetical protein
MSFFTNPKVVILGKSDTKNPVMQGFLQEIQTSQIPYDFLDTVFVTLDSEERYRINKKYLKDGVNYDSIGDDLARLGVSQDVILIEVIVDLDLAYQELKEKANFYLDSLFNED